MRTAAKTRFAALGALVLVGGGLALATPAVAQDFTSVSVGNAAPPAASPSPVEAPAMPADLPFGGDGDKDRELKSLKTPDSVKNTVKKLNNATNAVSMEDMNSAREAIVRLDALIDIEKRLSDLEKIRQEREGKSAFEVLPASALKAPAPPPAPPPMPVSPFPTMPTEAFMPPAMGGEPEVLRISAAAGYFVALMKVGDGKEVQVRVGEKLADGSEVKRITAKEVTLLRHKKTETVRIKDVGPIFNH